MSSPVSFSASGLPETVLPPVADEVAAALAAAGEDRSAVAAVVAANPRFLLGWATLGRLAPDRVESYAYFRVGYHRGLDALRAAGWRGSGYVRWRHPTNRGFLLALDGLGRRAAEIGEHEEADRIATFLTQLDPEWDRSDGGPDR